MPRNIPTREEQEEMNKALEDATPVERSRISFVQIDLGELGAYRAEIPPELARKFASDLVNGILDKGKKAKNTAGGNFARDIIARSFHLLQQKIKGGEKGADIRWYGEGPEPPPMGNDGFENPF